MKRFAVLSSIALAFCLHVSAQVSPGGKLTLKQCVETGITNNLQVQQSGLTMQSDEINWKQAKLNLLPDLNANANQGLNQGRSIDPFTNGYINQNYNYGTYGILSGVVLFNGLSLQNSIKQTSLAYQASKMDWQQAKDNLTILIILSYLQVLTNEDLLEQANNQLTVSKEQVDRLEVLNSQGAVPPAQLYDLKGQYANDQLNIFNTQNSLESSKINLCQLMNIPYDKNMQLERLDAASFVLKYENTPDKVYETSLQNFALIKAVDLRQQSSEKGVKVAKGTLYPTLSLNANANTNYSSAAQQFALANTTDVVSDDYVLISGVPNPVIKKQNNYNSDKIAYGSQLNSNIFTSVNLNLRVPIFNSLQARNRVKLAKLTLKNDELVANTTKTQLQRNIEQAYINLTTALDKYKTLLNQVDAFTESFHSAEVRFNSGLGTSVDYMIAKNNLDRSNINLITTRYDFVLRTKILDFYEGKQLW